MKIASTLLAGALLVSPALFAQQSGTATDNTQQSTQQTTTTKQSAKANLTPEQKAELKQLRAKTKADCKADKSSDTCKQDRQELKAKKSELGLSAHHGHHKKHGTATSQQPS